MTLMTCIQDPSPSHCLKEAAKPAVPARCAQQKIVNRKPDTGPNPSVIRSRSILGGSSTLSDDPPCDLIAQNITAADFGGKRKESASQDIFRKALGQDLSIHIDVSDSDEP